MSHELDDCITIAQAAELVRRTPRAVRYWTAGEDPRLPSVVDSQSMRRVRVAELVDLERDMRGRRADRPRIT
jgi:hypothetical protein